MGFSFMDKADNRIDPKQVNNGLYLIMVLSSKANGNKEKYIAISLIEN